MVQSIPLGHSTITRREAHVPYHGFTLGCAELVLSERGSIPHAADSAMLSRHVPLAKEATLW